MEGLNNSEAFSTFRSFEHGQASLLSSTANDFSGRNFSLTTAKRIECAEATKAGSGIAIGY
jgi:hypothetical protein